MELAETLRAAIADNSALINATAQRWPDRPIQLELFWMPSMGKLDLVIKTVDHMPSWKPKREADPSAADLAGQVMSEDHTRQHGKR